MAYRKRGRPPGSAKARTAKVLVKLRNREQEWIDVPDEAMGQRLRGYIGEQIKLARMMPGEAITIDCAPYAELTLVTEDIVSVRYIPGTNVDDASQETK